MIRYLRMLLTDIKLRWKLRNLRSPFDTERDWHDKFDKKGRPINLRTWCRLTENGDYRRVATTVLPNGYRVSTVWLGLNHRFGALGPPLIFETMVFPPPYAAATTKEERLKSWEDLDMDRYSTEQEAKEGHKRMVEKWKNEKPYDWGRRDSV